MPGAPKLRSDVQRNRAAILEAAQELFASTSQVPMYEIAKRAGVGQATLYRHFPDRSAIAAALAMTWIAELEQLAAERAGQPGAFLVLLRALFHAVGSCHTLIDIGRENPRGDAAFDRLQERARTVFRQPLAEAQACGLVRADIQVDLVFLMVRMLAGGLDSVADPALRTTTMERALDLMLRGISR